jgi:hypothetical protein
MVEADLNNVKFRLFMYTLNIIQWPFFFNTRSNPHAGTHVQLSSEFHWPIFNTRISYPLWDNKLTNLMKINFKLFTFAYRRN